MMQLSPEEWSEFSALLDAALELPRQERAQWLEELKSRNPHMAAHVEQALSGAGREDFAGFMEELPSLAAESPPESSLAGRQVGPYVIESEIGRGGMGSVWRARRTDGRFEGVVAIKFVRAGWMGQLGEQRFRIEGRLLGKLNHPNIARLMDAGILDNQPYLILEYVEGMAIDAYCARHQLGLEARLRLFLEVLAAISHAHQHLIVHRDIKPSNIFVTATGEVKLLDFGIAKFLSDEGNTQTGSEPAAATRFVGAVLTPEYAAPEQFQGQPVTTATDVFSAGLVLYLLLTGTQPVRSQEPRRPSTVAGLAQVPAGALAGDLDNILMRALKNDPVERYPSAEAFAEDIGRYLAYEPVLARPDSMPYRFRKFVRRNRGAFAAGVLLASSLIAGAAGTIVQSRRAQASAAQALQEKQQAIEQLTYAEATEDFLQFLLENESSKPFTTRDLLLDGERLARGEFANDPQMRAKLLLTLGDVYAEIEEQPKAQELFLAAQSAARAGHDRSLQTEVDCSLYENVGGGVPMQTSLERLAATTRAARADPSIDTSVLVRCLNNLSDLEVELKNPQAGGQDARAALQILGTPRPGQRALAIAARTNLATALDLAGEHAASLQQYEKVLHDLDEMGRSRTERTLSLISEYGIVLSRSGQLLKAASEYEYGLAIASRAPGAEQIRPSLETNYAKLLTDLGRPAEARPLFDAALEVATRKGNLRSLMYVELLSAPTYCELGDLAGCQQRIAKAEELAKAQFPPRHSVFGTMEFVAAQLAAAQGNSQAARTHLKSAIAIYAAGADRNPNEIRARARLAQADLQLGDLEAASADADDAVAKGRAALHGLTYSAWLGSALLIQGEVRAAKGDKTAARSILEQSVRQLEETAGASAPATREARSRLDQLKAGA